MKTIIAALLWVWAAWLSRRALPVQNVALIFGVVDGPERDVAYREHLEQRAREVDKLLPRSES